jgi:hypothetical protein
MTGWDATPHWGTFGFQPFSVASAESILYLTTAHAPACGMAFILYPLAVVHGSN